MPKLFQNEMSELLTNQNFEIKIVELNFLPAETVLYVKHVKEFFSKQDKYVEIVLENTQTLIQVYKM